MLHSVSCAKYSCCPCWGRQRQTDLEPLSLIMLFNYVGSPDAVMGLLESVWAPAKVHWSSHTTLTLRPNCVFMQIVCKYFWCPYWRSWSTIERRPSHSYLNYSPYSSVQTEREHPSKNSSERADQMYASKHGTGDTMQRRYAEIHHLSAAARGGEHLEMGRWIAFAIFCFCVVISASVFHLFLLHGALSYECVLDISALFYGRWGRLSMTWTMKRWSHTSLLIGKYARHILWIR